MSTQFTPGLPVGKHPVLPLPTPPKSQKLKVPVPLRSAKVTPVTDTVMLSTQQAPKPVFTPRQLFIAVSTGSTRKVQEILDSGIPVNSRDGFGNTVIHKAAFYGYPDIVRDLKKRGADVDAKGGKHRQTPLHKAAYRGHIKTAKALIDLGANVKTTDRFGNTPLHAAVRDGNNKLVTLLLSQDAVEVNAADHEGNTPSHKAAHHGHISTLKLLARHGGNLDQPNHKGETPLDLLLKVRPSTQIQSIRNAALKATTLKSTQDAPKMQSMEKSIADKVEETRTEEKAFEPKPLTVDSETNTQEDVSAISQPSSPVSLPELRPIHHSWESNSYEELHEKIKESLANSQQEDTSVTDDIDSRSIPELSDLSASDLYSRPPLHQAAANGDLDQVKSLIKPYRGLFFNDPEKPLWARIFLPLGQKLPVNETDQDGNTALHEAVRNQHWPVAEFLLEQGADPYRINQEGWAPAEEIPWPISDSWPK
jgi:ankyrin repeat protein